MNNDLEQFSEERLQRYINQFAEDGMCDITDDEIMPLIRIALAAKQAKPVAQVYQPANIGICAALGPAIRMINFGLPAGTLLYTTPQPAHTEQDGWIKCSERMPEVDEHKPIAIYTGNCIGQGMFVACYDEDGFYDYWDGVEISGISHWMPLPSPPVAAPKPESE